MEAKSIFTMATGRLRKYHQIAADEGGSSTDVKSQSNQQQSRVPASLSWDSGYNEGSESQESFILQMMNMPSVVVTDVSDSSDTADFVEGSDPSPNADNENILQQPNRPTPSPYSLSNCSHFIEQTDRQHWSWSTSTSLRSHPPGFVINLPIQTSPDDESSYLSVRRLSDCSSSSSIASQASSTFL